MQRTITKTKIASDIKSLQGKKVLVLGDIMLDRYQYGKVERVSPEAPVPVVRIDTEEYRLGGAGNVARNISSLGGTPFLLGICGQDNAGLQLEDILKEESIDHELMGKKEWLTTIKTRVLARGQQIVRVDREKQDSPPDKLNQRVKNALQTIMPEYEVLIISDYGKGLINSELLKAAREIATAKQIKVFIDPKLPNFDLYQDSFLMTPNQAEAGAGAKINIEQDEELLDAGNIITTNNNCRNLLVTMGSKGMVLFQENQDIWQIPTMARKVYDVTGAGDTVIAVTALAQSAGCDLLTSCILANYAAGIVVGQVGTAAVSKEELKQSIEDQSEPIIENISHKVKKKKQ